MKKRRAYSNRLSGRLPRARWTTRRKSRSASAPLGAPSPPPISRPSPRSWARATISRKRSRRRGRKGRAVDERTRFGDDLSELVGGRVSHDYFCQSLHVFVRGSGRERRTLFAAHPRASQIAVLCHNSSASRARHRENAAHQWHRISRPPLTRSNLTSPTI